MKLISEPEGLTVQVDDQKIAQEDLRSPIISQLASSVASLPLVREWLLPIQQEMGKSGCVVAEGRDMGTRVFPEADLKFFLDADLEIRAIRRQKEEIQKGVVLDLQTVKNDMQIRDTRDRTREVDPLRPAHGANIIDTSRQSIEEVVSSMISRIMEVS